jgi:lactate permease
LFAYFLWSLPILAIAGLIAAGRTTALGAGLCGAALAGAIALTTSPNRLSLPDLLISASHGIWLSWLVGLVILSGLFFRNIVATALPSAYSAPEGGCRRRAFAACFLVGPFTECSTGFGAGQVATAALLRSVGISPANVVLLALFSQVLVPWGAMANGTVVGAELSGLNRRELGVGSAILTIPLLALWLSMFWRIASQAGLYASRSDLLSEAAWLSAGAALLVLTNWALGPEIAGMAALGPLIVLHFWRDARLDRQAWAQAIKTALPYAVLTIGLVFATGLVPVSAFLSGLLRIRPFTDGPVWLPLIHPGCWLIAVGLITALATGRLKLAGQAASRAWGDGRNAVLTIAAYLVMARVMADSGIALALARGLRELFGPAAVLAVPLLAGAFGFLTGSCNATNGLLMPSHAALAAEERKSLFWLAAIQNTTAAALTMLSPARVAMACALVHRAGLERETYLRAWPWAVGAMFIMSGIALSLP